MKMEGTIVDITVNCPNNKELKLEKLLPNMEENFQNKNDERWWTASL